MKEIDANGDGEIDFDEFMDMMKKATEFDDSYKKSVTGNYIKDEK